MSAERSTAAKARGPVGLVGVVRRLGWGVGDQAVSSLSNFAISVFLAHTLGARGFGAFTLVFVSYSVVVSACRGVGTDPQLVRASRLEETARARAESAASATALVVGILTGAVCVVLGLLVPPAVGMPFVALGVGLPGLMLQDSWRFCFFARGRGDQALVNDAAWGILLLVALAGLTLTGRLDPTTAMLAFGVTATLAAVLGAAQARLLPDLRAVRAWVVDNHALGGPFLVENVALGGARQVRVFALGAIAGLAPVGYIRGGEVLMGPFLVVLMGVSQVAVPEVAQVLRDRPGRLPRFCLALGGAQAFAAVLWGVAVALLLPFGLGQAMLGDLWRPAAALLVPITLQLALACFCTGAGAGLRAMGAARRSLGVQAVGSLLYVAGGVGGVLLPGMSDALGSSWGLVLGQLLAAGLWWLVLLRTHARHLAATGGASAPEDDAGPGSAEVATEALSR